MKKYWLIIDSYVFIWKNEINVLVYNTLSGKGFECSLSPVLDIVVTKLLDTKNMYCIGVSNIELDDDQLSFFVRLLRINYCGDIILSENVDKPISIFPKLNINEAVDRDYGGIDNFESFGHQVARNLLEFTLYLNGDLEKSDIQKQIMWFLSGEYKLSLDDLNLIFCKIKDVRILEFNIVAENVFEYPHLENLYSLLQNYTFKVSFYLYYKSNFSARDFLPIIENEKYNCYLFLDFPIDYLILEKISCWNIPMNYVAKITSIDEYNQIQNISDKYQIDIKLSPYFDGTNYSFFQKYIYINKEDILETQWSKQEIFSHQVLNTNDFGKLSMIPTGDIYANTFFNPVGTVRDDIKHLVYKELKEGLSWRRTRDTMNTCDSCLYRYVCPSPSNYELILNKSNLCFLND